MWNTAQLNNCRLDKLIDRKLLKVQVIPAACVGVQKKVTSCQNLNFYQHIWKILIVACEESFKMSKHIIDFFHLNMIPINICKDIVP